MLCACYRVFHRCQDFADGKGRRELGDERDRSPTPVRRARDRTPAKLRGAGWGGGGGIG